MNIILCGPGRSGTTLFNQLFSFHPDFVWISSWVAKFPEIPQLSFFNSIYQSHLIGINWAKVKLAPKPTEAYGFWRHYFKPFRSDNTDYDTIQLEKAKRNLKKIKQFSGKDHFVTKITGDTRAQILNPLFDNDIIWIWIERDPRVVVSSYIKQKWGYKNKLEKFSKLSMEDKIRINCKRYMAFYKDAEKLSNKKILFYEDLCKSPERFFDDLFKVLNLTLDKKQREVISNWDIKPVGWNVYKNNYNKDEQDLLHKLLNEPLTAYGYAH